MKETIWSPELVAALVTMWNDGHLSAKAIGKELGISKHQVIGKAHRLGLKSRMTLAQEGAAAARRARSAQPLPPLDLHCKWPLVRVKDRWTFCESPRLPGKPYCDLHMKRGHQQGSASVPWVPKGWR